MRRSGPDLNYGNRPNPTEWEKTISHTTDLIAQILISNMELIYPFSSSRLLGPQTIHVDREFTIDNCLVYAVQCEQRTTNIHCKRFTWSWRGFDGVANYYLCRWNYVSKAYMKTPWKQRRAKFEIWCSNGPCLIYFSEPKFRGIMIAYTHVGWTLGLLLVSVLNTLMPWRTVALVCMFVPILTTLALCFVRLRTQQNPLAISS